MGGRWTTIGLHTCSCPHATPPTTGTLTSGGASAGRTPGGNTAIDPSAGSITMPPLEPGLAGEEEGFGDAAGRGAAGLLGLRG